MGYGTKQYIGVLYYNERTGKPGVFINRANSLQFTIKPLDENLQGVIPAYFNNFVQTEFVDQPELSAEERIQNALEELDDKLFLFFVADKEGGYQASYMVQSLPGKQRFKEENFISIPVFASYKEEEELFWQKNREKRWRLFRNYTSYDEWMTRVEQKEHVGRIYGYGENIPPHSFVIWREEKKLYAVGMVESCLPGEEGLMLEGKLEHTIDITDLKELYIYEETLNPTLAYLPESICRKIEQRFSDMLLFEENASVLTYDDVIEPEAEAVEEAVVEEVAGPEAEVVAEVVAEAVVETVIQPEETVKDVVSVPVDARFEECIIGAMQKKDNSRGRIYRSKDLVNTHLCIKCHPFVIFDAGNRTEKTEIVDFYLNAMGIYPKKEDIFQYKYILVRPSWKDETVFFGKVDLDNKMYRPSEAGFIEMLIRAQENPEKMFFICLDDMNLSYPELYLAPLFAVINKKPSHRYISLYSSGMKEYIQNADSYPEKVYIGNNIRFIGILNETEYAVPLSEAMLRRVNLIHMDEYVIEKDEAEWFDWMLEEGRNWTSTAYNETIETHRMVSGLLEHILHQMSEKVGKVDISCALTAREEKEICRYISNAANLIDSEFTTGDALDFQIAQRILTKIRGNAPMWEALLAEEGEESVIAFLNKFRQISSFEECRSMIRRKRG